MVRFHTKMLRERRGKALDIEGGTRTNIKIILLLLGATFAGACAGNGDGDQNPAAILGESYKILNITSGITSGDESAAKLCKGFIMSEKNIRTFLKMARPITEEQVHNNFDWAPCFVKADLATSKHTAIVEIHASGIASVSLDGKPFVKIGCAEECDDILKSKGNI